MSYPSYPSNLSTDLKLPRRRRRLRCRRTQDGEEMLRLLAKLGVNVEIPDNQGYTPVCIAAQKGHSEMLRLLD